MSTNPVQRAAALAPLLEKSTAETDRERRLPQVVVDAMLDAGLFHLLVPSAYGGEQIEPTVFVQVLEEIARHDASAAWCLGQTAVCAMAAAYLDEQPASTIWGPGTGILAWGSALSPVNAYVENDGYRVSGKWAFSSGGHHATYLGGHCVLADAPDKPRLREDGRPVARTVLFPASECEWYDTWDVIGLRGTASDSYSVDNLFVDAAFSVNLANRDERRIDAPLYRLRTPHMYACGFACITLGLARALLDSYVELANEKTPRGYKTTMRMSSVVQGEVAELEARLRSARTYVMSTLASAFEAAHRGELTTDERIAIRLAATHCIREGRAIANAAYDAVGTTAVFADNAFERRFRDVNSAAQHAQGRRTHFETVGRYLFDLEVDWTFL